MSATKEWNPRFEIYCKTQGVPPERMNSQERPGWTLGFTDWIRERMLEFKGVMPEAFYHGVYETNLVNHSEFDKWLKEKYG